MLFHFQNHRYGMLTNREDNMEISEGSLEIIIPAVLIILFVLILMLALYVTYYIIKKRGQRYRVVPAISRNPNLPMSPVDYGYDQP